VGDVLREMHLTTPDVYGTKRELLHGKQKNLRTRREPAREDSFTLGRAIGAEEREGDQSKTIEPVKKTITIIK